MIPNENEKFLWLMLKRRFCSFLFLCLRFFLLLPMKTVAYSHKLRRICPRVVVRFVTVNQRDVTDNVFAYRSTRLFCDSTALCNNGYRLFAVMAEMITKKT